MGTRNKERSQETHVTFSTVFRLVPQDSNRCIPNHSQIGTGTDLILQLVPSAAPYAIGRYQLALDMQLPRPLLCAY